MKTEIGIANDFYKIVRESALGEAVSRRVFHSESRPKNDTSECICINRVSGLDGQIEQGLVVLNIYTPDIVSGGEKMYNRPRLEQLQTLAKQLVRNFPSTDYKVELNGDAQTMYDTDISQHFVNVRISYSIFDADY